MSNKSADGSIDLQITTYTLYILLTLVNLLCYLPLILQLKFKNFHLLMFLLLQTCYLSQIAVFSLLDKFEWQLIFATFYYASDQIVHMIFDVKYWLLSRKILQYVNNKVDQHLSIKASVIFGLQMALILTTVTIPLFYQPHTFPNTGAKFYVFTFFFSLSPYVSMVILADGLLKLWDC